MFLFRIQAGELRNKLGDLLKRVQDLSPAMQEAIDTINESVLEEFDGAFYRSPSGAKFAWKPHVPFGTAPRRRLLWNRGRLKAAMTGGSGSASKYTNRTFSYGVEAGRTFSTDQGSGRRITLGEIVSIHRGGLGPVPKVGQVTVVKAKQRVESADMLQDGSPRQFKMYWKLRRGYGVRLSYRKMTEGLRIPARGFAAASTPIKNKIAKDVKAYILSKGRARGRK